MRLRFGSSTFDSDVREVVRNGRRVALTPKAFMLLEALVEARPQPIARDALAEMLWPSTFVEQGNLHNLVSEIRQALGDDDHQIIRTVHKFGYAFEAAGTIEEITQFAIDVGGEEIPLRVGKNVIGRDPADDISIASPEVSRHHARLIVEGSAVTIEDLGSKNGTYVGTARVTAPVVLKPGDEIIIGTTKLRLRVLRELPSTRTKT